ncbi:Lrp/AsnC family transcriptional regulator [Halobacterium bonnevillei]|uniref:ArsR family transcriptional regulator n=1 Tax=Halobacterium bonnevillei TaxID=2692200 RepID=A0A6B0SIT2_9EURY|nr:Lrp/AsnC family transcriptional regulator [Halobacterium bonnevillei]MXR21575.1 ArsR family transcriptional regulator [Halobacterium bonnevillei]
MDEQDVEILKAVAEVGEPSPKAIEAETGIPKSTVHYRLEKLRENGIVEDELFNLDLKAIGLNLTVITEVMADYEEGYHEEVGEQLSAIQGVNQVYFTMGDTDFIVIAHLSSREMVEELVVAYEGIDAIQRTSTNFAITTIKNERIPLRNYDLDTLKDIVMDD